MKKIPGKKGRQTIFVGFVFLLFFFLSAYEVKLEGLEPGFTLSQT